MVALLVSVLIGVLILWIVWRLLRVVLAVVFVALLLALGIGALHRFDLGRDRSLGPRVAAVGHTFAHDAQRIEHGVTRH